MKTAILLLENWCLKLMNGLAYLFCAYWKRRAIKAHLKAYPDQTPQEARDYLDEMFEAWQAHESQPRRRDARPTLH